MLRVNYIDDSNITISTLGMPASTNVGAVSQARTGNSLDNITYTIPITVPSTATAGTITVNGCNYKIHFAIKSR